MELHLTRDAASFGELAGPLLTRRIELNVIATVLDQAVRGEHSQEAPLFAYGLDDRGEVAFAALRTPPWMMLASGIEPPSATELLSLWMSDDPELPGVSGEPAVAGAIAAAWQRLTGGTERVRMSAAMHVLTEVTGPARPAAGVLRSPSVGERNLLVAWEEAFVREAGVGVAGQAARTIDRRMSAGMQLVWEDERPVSTLAVTAPVAGVVRIAAVYTPPALRGRGYAGSAVAAASRRSLAAGAERCMLFTDLANPTSNRLYASLGYRRIGAWEDRVFNLA
jgi:predicted GNAT family acetyltransferase